MNRLAAMVLLLWLPITMAGAQQRTKPRKARPAEPQVPYEQEDTQDKTEDSSADKTEQEKPFERLGRHRKAERIMVITDFRGHAVELTDFHLGSSGLWEYDGLRMKKSEPAPPIPQERVAKVRTMQRQIDHRIRNKNNKEAQLPRVRLNKDTVVKWDEIKEVQLTKNRDEQNATVTYTARIITTNNRLIEGRIKDPSDYVIGKMEGNKEVYFRLRDIKRISFSSPEAKGQAKTFNSMGAKTDRPRAKTYKSETSNAANQAEKTKPKQKDQ